MSEVLNKNENFRIDDDYFKKSFIKNEAIIQTNGFELLDDISHQITDFGAYSQMNFVEFIEDENGVIFLRNQDIKDNFIDLSSCVKISNIVYQKLTLKLDSNDVVIPRVGSLGNAAVVSDDMLPCSANQNLAIIKPNLNKIVPLFLSTLLVSKYCRNQIDRNSTGNVQQWLNLGIIKNIKVPILSNTFQLEIERLVKSAHAKLEESKALYAEAEKMLLDELGLSNWQPSNENVAVKSLKESFLETGRLDAEFYQPKYDEIEAKIKSLKNCGWDLLANHFEQNKSLCDRTKKGYNYIEIGDINTSNGQANFNYVLTEDLPANAKVLVRKNDLLISKVRPYRGAISILNFEEKDLVASGAFTVLRENGNINKETLSVLLRTDIYKDLMLKFNVGSSYPVIKDEDILALPIPLVENNLQEQIAIKIKSSSVQISESKQLLDLAKQAVEVAIEQDENAALAMIKE